LDLPRRQIGSWINGTGTSNRTEFAYDGFGNRVKIIERTGQTVTSTKKFLFCGNELKEERSATDVVTRRYDAVWDLHTHETHSPSVNPFGSDDMNTQSVPWVVNPWEVWRMGIPGQKPFLMPKRPCDYFPGARSYPNSEAAPLGSAPNPTGYPHR
jgi:YD repeat-containing protein